MGYIFLNSFQSLLFWSSLANILIGHQSWAIFHILLLPYVWEAIQVIREAFSCSLRIIQGDRLSFIFCILIISPPARVFIWEFVWVLKAITDVTDVVGIYVATLTPRVHVFFLPSIVTYWEIGSKYLIVSLHHLSECYICFLFVWNWSVCYIFKCLFGISNHVFHFH